MDMEGGIKDRRQARLLVKIEVMLNNSIKSYALDLSEGGMFIYTHVPFPQGTSIDISFNIGEDDTTIMNTSGRIREGAATIKTSARVQFMKGGVGFGVVFTNLIHDDVEKLKRFIAENMHAHPLGAEAGKADTRKKVLIVDSSASARSIYKNKLAFMGCIVREASSGAEVIELLDKERPDVMVVDIQMVGMDGVKLLQLLHTNEEWKKVKVIVLSGKISSDDAEKISALGVADILSKMTTTPNKLVERVKAVLASG